MLLLLCFHIRFSTCGILYSYRRVCTVRGEMCGFPLTRTVRHHIHRHCCVVLRPATRWSTTTAVPRSNGSRGVPSGILLTTHTHIYTIFPCCRCAPRVYIHTQVYIHRIHYTLVVVVPRVSATSSAPRFPLLRYWHIASLSFPPLHSTLFYTTRPILRSRLRVHCKCTCVFVCALACLCVFCVCSHYGVYTNVYNRVLPGTCSRCVYA